MQSLEKILPSIQNTLEAQGRMNYTLVDRESNRLQDGPKAAIFTTRDRRSSGLQRNSEAETAQKSWENCLRKCFMHQNSRQMSRQSSVDSYTSKQNRDTYSCETNCLATTQKASKQKSSLINISRKAEQLYSKTN